MHLYQIIKIYQTTLKIWFLFISTEKMFFRATRKTNFSVAISILSLLVFLISFLSCQKSSSWKDYNVCSSNKEFSSSSLTYDPPHNLIKLEFLKIKEKISCFLTLPSPKNVVEKKIIPIILSNKNEKIIIQGYLREGNQRISLEDRARDFIVKGLKNNESIVIKVEEIEELIIPELFKKKYENFYTARD
jgi:hypothetical protein